MSQAVTEIEPARTAGVDAAIAQKNFALALEYLYTEAQSEVKAVANLAGNSLEGIDASCRKLAEQLAVELPVSTKKIGFDRPTNIYLVTEIYQAGGHRSLIDQMIAARPDERHIVLFTGALENTREYSLKTIVVTGGFAIFPDASLGLFDRLLWLREKMAAFTARRLFILHHPDDVIAGVALAEFAASYGRRAYVVHHADTVASVGVDIEGATHLAIRPEQKEMISHLRPDRAVYLIPLTYDPEQLDPPIPEDVARRIDSKRKDFLSTGFFVTASCGGAHKFLDSGPLGLPAMIVTILRATRGRHVHIGPLPVGLQLSIQMAMTEARIPEDRIVFTGEVRSVAESLVENKVDLFLNSFPVGGGLTVVEAAYARMPIAVYRGADDAAGRYISGVTNAPKEALIWDSPEDLQEALHSFWLDDGADRLSGMSEGSRNWFLISSSGQKFRRRLLAIIAVSEGRWRDSLETDRHQVGEALIDRAYYLKKYPDVELAELDPVDHFDWHGEEELRSPNALFDPDYYLSQLPKAERDTATKAPLIHYVARGESMGCRPHPLFDPAFCRASFMAAGQWAEETGDVIADCVLARYLNHDGAIAPHMFFDPKHYARQVRQITEGQALLVHFVETGAKERLSPHPLIRPDLIAKSSKNWYQTFLTLLTREISDEGELSPTPFFNPEFFSNGKQRSYANAAPNLLWAHLIEGNQSGRDPQELVSVRHVARMRPDTLISADAIIRRLALNRLGVDTHPLVSGRHILKQAPNASTLPISLTEYFIENCVTHNIDPHPFFSTQFYLYKYPDLHVPGLNPLVHYLKDGQFEGRLPHPAFDGNHYYKLWLKHQGGGSPLIDYLSRGMALFRPSLPMNDGLRDLTRKTAVGLFHIARNRASDDMLASALHPENVANHPTLMTQTCPFTIEAEDAAETVVIHAAETVFLDRPSVVSQKHIAPPIGDYVAPAATASLYRDATQVPGNDGFLTSAGLWVDHGLCGFDDRTMRVKDNGAVVAMADGHVLLRRYRSGMSLPAGIFASGTYSHNYFHFLMEVLPRVLLAAELAPAGTPILADDGMPDQHYQALRLFLPDHPVLRLSRHLSVKVGKLYVGSMPSFIQDAFDIDMPPADAVRFHPEMVRQIAGVFADGHRDGERKRLYLHRDSTIRRVLNAGELHDTLVERGFDVVQCANLSFSEQVRAFSQASDIVGQSGAHLANMLFAPKGARVFALFSNVPGTNYYLWSALGALLGHEVTNVVGWRIAGSVAGRAPKVHEDFTMPTVLLTPFFPKTTERPPLTAPKAEARALLDDLFDANAEADSLTGAWSVLSKIPPPSFDNRLIRSRRQLHDILQDLPIDEIEGLLDHQFFTGFANNLRSGFVTLREHNEREQETIEAIHRYFITFSAEAPLPDDDGLESVDVLTRQERRIRDIGKPGLDEFPRMLALAMVYTPAWHLQLIGDLTWIDPHLRKTYLAWLATPPFLFRNGDDAGYVDFTARLLDWLAEQLDPDQPAELRKLAGDVAVHLDLGQLLLVGEPLRPVLAARNRLLERVALSDGQPPRALPRPADLSQGRIRVGILCRTFIKGPDSEAVVAFFKEFDPTRFEVYAYSVAFQDRVVAPDEDFDRTFDAVISHRRVVPNDPHDMRECLLADDLDVFLYANATTFGVREQELALFRRVAPLQIVLNSHLPMSPGFPSFDAFLTGLSDDPAAEVSDEDYPERILRVDGPVINYLNSLKPRPKPSFDRATLGLSDDDVVMMNGGSSQKLRHECLITMLRALHGVPNGKLLLAPYNPGWAARSQAFAFHRQLSEAAAEVGVSMDRVIVLGELSVAEAEAALSLSDIYLSSFPHGGATMTHLALIYGVPPVVLRRRDTRSIDQFLVGSLGFSQMLASTPDDYVQLVARLAGDAPYRQGLSEDIGKAARHPVFVANPEFSRAMQAEIVQALAEIERAAATPEVPQA